MAERVLTLYVIYDHPLDYPEHFVLRAQHVFSGGKIVSAGLALLDCELEPLRELCLRNGLACLPRSEDDDPQIVESWI